MGTDSDGSLLSTFNDGAVAMAPVTGSSITVVATTNPTFSSLAAPSIAYGASSATFGGTISGSSGTPTGNVEITLTNNVTHTVLMDQLAPINSSNGNFSYPYDPSSLPVSASPYTVTYAYAGDSNYNAITGGTSLTVNPADAHASVTAIAGLIYSGGAQTTAAGTATDVFGHALPSSDFDLSHTSHTNAGAYSGDTWSFSDPSGNYLAASGTVNDSIGQAEPTVTVGNESTTYTGSALAYPDSDVTVTGANGLNNSGGALSYTYNGSATVPILAGSYTVVVTFAPTDATDYTTATGTATWTINPATLTWIGGDPAAPNSWSDAKNWSPGVTPGADGSGGDSLIFDSAYAHAFASQNDIAGLSLASIQITDNNSTAGDDFTISGNALILTGPGGISNNMVGTATTVSLAGITLGGSDNSANSQGTLNVASPIDLAGHTLAVDGAGATNIGNVVSSSTSGTDALIKNGSGTLTLSASNTYDGTTTINDGVLTAAASGALGTVAGGTVVNSGGALAFPGGVAYATAEPVQHRGDRRGRRRRHREPKRRQFVHRTDHARRRRLHRLRRRRADPQRPHTQPGRLHAYHGWHRRHQHRRRHLRLRDRRQCAGQERQRHAGAVCRQHLHRDNDDQRWHDPDQQRRQPRWRRRQRGLRRGRDQRGYSGGHWYHADDLRPRLYPGRFDEHDRGRFLDLDSHRLHRRDRNAE